MKLAQVSLLALPILAGCAINPREIGREPELSPVGAGVNQPVLKMPTDAAIHKASYQSQSFWRDSSADLFKDPRSRFRFRTRRRWTTPRIGRATPSTTSGCSSTTT